MGSERPGLRMRANRVAAFEIAFIGLLFELGIMWSVGPDLPTVPPASWSLDGWVIVVVCGIMVVPFGCIALLGLYWFVAPWPYLTLDATRMVFQPYPFVKRTIRWSDVQAIQTAETRPASKSVYSRGRPSATKLHIAIKPDVRAAYHGKSELTLVINRFLLNTSRDELLKTLRRYHQVSMESRG